MLLSYNAKTLVIGRARTHSEPRTLRCIHTICTVPHRHCTCLHILADARAAAGAGGREGAAAHRQAAPRSGGQVRWGVVACAGTQCLISHYLHPVYLARCCTRACLQSSASSATSSAPLSHPLTHTGTHDTPSPAPQGTTRKTSRPPTKPPAACSAPSSRRWPTRCRRCGSRSRSSAASARRRASTSRARRRRGRTTRSGGGRGARRTRTRASARWRCGRGNVCVGGLQLCAFVTLCAPAQVGRHLQLLCGWLKARAAPLLCTHLHTHANNTNTQIVRGQMQRDAMRLKDLEGRLGEEQELKVCESRSQLSVEFAASDLHPQHLHYTSYMNTSHTRARWHVNQAGRAARNADEAAAGTTGRAAAAVCNLTRAHTQSPCTG